MTRPALIVVTPRDWDRMVTAGASWDDVHELIDEVRAQAAARVQETREHLDRIERLTAVMEGYRLDIMNLQEQILAVREADS